MNTFNSRYRELIKEYAVDTVTAPAKPATTPSTTPRPQHPMAPKPGIQPRPKAEEEQVEDPEALPDPVIHARGNRDVLQFLRARNYATADN